ncbi:MAG: hypothetical protein DHS80DRAFT_32298 [Piptocephalis tieghemiana]|nr:MAG: hypothetical protein DHS80DRAFT_32298 [Piptocephalis tieghemiana]
MSLGPWLDRVLKLNELDPQRYTTSYLLQPKFHAAFRLLLFTYALSVALAAFIQNALLGQAWHFLFYYTHLSYMALTLYLGLAGLYTLAYALQPPEYPEPRLLPCGSWAFRSLSILYMIVVAAHCFVPVVYWLFLYDPNHQPSPASLWTNISQHGGDTLLLLLEISSSRILFRFRDLLPATLSVLIYIPWMWMSYVWKHFWIYPPFALGPGSGPWIAYFGAFLSILILQVVMVGLHRVREFLGQLGGRWEQAEDARIAKCTYPKSITIV